MDTHSLITTIANCSVQFENNFQRDCVIHIFDELYGGAQPVRIGKDSHFIKNQLHLADFLWRFLRLANLYIDLDINVDLSLATWDAMIPFLVSPHFRHSTMFGHYIAYDSHDRPVGKICTDTKLFVGRNFLYLDIY